MALEILEQADNLDAIIAPIGGGGMVSSHKQNFFEMIIILLFMKVSGICIAVKARNPNILVFAAEPEEADDAFRYYEISLIDVFLICLIY